MAQNESSAFADAIISRTRLIFIFPLPVKSGSREDNWAKESQVKREKLGMAGKRVAKSLVDWAAFAERVPPAERDIFRLFKAKSTGFVTKIFQYPENLPAIDFSAYKKLLNNPKLVEPFEAGYAALSIPYPTDKDNVKDAVLAEEKEAEVDMKKQIEGLQNIISEAELMLNKLDTLPKPYEMTHEMFADYFPESAVNPDKPTMYPHAKPYQPENNPNFLK